MSWVVEFHEDFEPEFNDLPEEVKDEVFMRTTLDDLLKELPLERQKKIEARAAELIAEVAKRQQRKQRITKRLTRGFSPWQLEQIYKAVRVENPRVEQGKNLIFSSLVVQMGEKTRK